VIDRSGSMAESGKLDGAKDAARAFVEQMRPGDRTALIAFSSDTRVVQPFTSDKASLLDAIDQIEPDGGTALYDAVSSAYTVLQGRAAKNPMRTHAVVVMTDGNDESSKLTLIELKKRFPGDEAAIKVFTIAYGESADADTLARIARASGGTFYPATDTRAIDRVLLDVVGSF
jgi:Ca-activated chloride channel family protein